MTIDKVIDETFGQNHEGRGSYETHCCESTLRFY